MRGETMDISGRMHDDTIYQRPDDLTTRATGFIEQVDVHKPWGSESLIVRTEQYVMKFLRIKAGERLSVQYHERKRETLHCLEGEGIALLGMAGEAKELKTHVFKPGATLHIEPMTVHTYEAITDMLLVEVSTPEIDDVVRLEDRYGRAR